MGDGMLSLVVGEDGHLHAVSGITTDIADNGPFILLYISPDQRPVTAFCRLVEELVAEIRLGIRSLGYHQQAGGVLVDAVHQSHMRVIGIIIGIILHMPGYGVDKRTVIVAMTGVHHQTGRFVHYHQILVLIYYIKGMSSGMTSFS